jgi:hypothetical protein
VSALEQQVPDHGDGQVTKVAEPQPSIMLGEAVLKWYDIAPLDAPVPLAIRALARRCLRDGRKAGTLDVEDGLGFVLLDRCEEDVYFLLVSTWRNERERCETIWAKRGDDVFFHPWPTGDTHRPRSCVSEQGPVAHEQEAWMRFLGSTRDKSSMHAYLRDCFSGVV